MIISQGQIPRNGFPELSDVHLGLLTHIVMCQNIVPLSTLQHLALRHSS